MKFQNFDIKCNLYTHPNFNLFEYYEISAVKINEDQDIEVCEEHEADAFSIYGRTWDEEGKVYMAIAVGDFETKEGAEKYLTIINKLRGIEEPLKN